MYQQALEGYEKALGLENAVFYIPALNTVYNLGMLFSSRGDVDRARAMYLRALIGYQKVYGQDNQDYQDVQEKLNALHISASERITSTNAKGDCTPTSSQGVPHFDVPGVKSASKRRRFLQKLGLR